MIAIEPIVLITLSRHLKTTLMSTLSTVTTSWWMRRGQYSKLGARLSSMPSFFFTTASYTFRQRRHFFVAEYLNQATGWTKSFNMRWTWSFSSGFRNVAIAFNIFRNSLHILGCSLTEKRVAPRIGNEQSIV